MNVIKTYTDTQCELNIAKERLSLLLDRKEELYIKYCGKTVFYGDKVQGKILEKDNMIDYLHDLNEIDYGTGRSLADEIEYQRKIISVLQNHIKNMASNLNKLNGLEYKLFYEIVYVGNNISKSVEIIAEKFNVSTRNVWRFHYTKIKEYLKQMGDIEEIFH